MMFPLNHGVMAAVAGGGLDSVELEPNTQYVLSNSNLTATNDGGGARGVCVGSVARSSGRYYFEIEVVQPGVGSNSNAIGIVPPGVSGIDAGTTIGGNTAMGGGYMYNGAKYIKTSYSNGYGPSFGAGDVIGVLCDIDGGSLRFSKNGVLQPVIAFDFTTDGGAWLPAFNTSYDSGSGTPSEHNARFAAASMEYLPAGYKAWAEAES